MIPNLIAFLLQRKILVPNTISGFAVSLTMTDVVGAASQTVAMLSAGLAIGYTVWRWRRDISIEKDRINDKLEDKLNDRDESTDSSESVRNAIKETLGS